MRMGWAEVRAEDGGDYASKWMADRDGVDVLGRCGSELAHKWANANNASVLLDRESS
jgi:hypothetical protein